LTERSCCCVYIRTITCANRWSIDISINCIIGIYFAKIDNVGWEGNDAWVRINVFRIESAPYLWGISIVYNPTIRSVKRIKNESYGNLKTKITRHIPYTRNIHIIVPISIRRTTANNSNDTSCESSKGTHANISRSEVDACC